MYAAFPLRHNDWVNDLKLISKSYVKMKIKN